jgi:hypothetical protein
MLNDLLWLKSGAVMVATGGPFFHPPQKWRGVRGGRADGLAAWAVLSQQFCDAPRTVFCFVQLEVQLRRVADAQGVRERRAQEPPMLPQCIERSLSLLRENSPGRLRRPRRDEYLSRASPRRSSRAPGAGPRASNCKISLNRRWISSWSRAKPHLLIGSNDLDLVVFDGNLFAVPDGLDQLPEQRVIDPPVVADDRGS